MKRICSAPMRTPLLVLALFAAPALASQTVWKWVDEKGITHYSDRPVPGAQRVEISISSRADPVRAIPPPPQEPERQAGPPYSNFEILSPAQNDVLINTGGRVEVRLSFEPDLRAGHSLQLFLDGERVEDFAPGAREYTLTDVPRGLHTLVARIQDDRGQSIQQTQPVQFMVRQHSIAQPPVGPALRPPPKPPRGQSANKLPNSQPSYSALNGQRPAIDPSTNLPVKTKK